MYWVLWFSNSVNHIQTFWESNFVLRDLATSIFCFQYYASLISVFRTLTFLYFVLLFYPVWYFASHFLPFISVGSAACYYSGFSMSSTGQNPATTCRLHFRKLAHRWAVHEVTVGAWLPAFQPKVTNGEDAIYPDCSCHQLWGVPMKKLDRTDGLRWRPEMHK